MPSCYLYYWWQNIKGIEESSDKALRVMQITTVMVVILWLGPFIRYFMTGAPLPPLPILQTSNSPRGSRVPEEH